MLVVSYITDISEIFLMTQLPNFFTGHSMSSILLKYKNCEHDLLVTVNTLSLTGMMMPVIWKLRQSSVRTE